MGPAHHKGSYTMAYSETHQAYLATAIDFSPQSDVADAINLTTTTGLDTGWVDFTRAYVVPSSTIQTVTTEDNRFVLTVVSSDTLPAETYVAVVPSYAPPGPVPWGHRLIGSTYNARAAGALITTDRPMSLRLYYDPATLLGADPHTLAVHRWDAFQERWADLGGRLFYTQGYLALATSHFGAYALVSAPRWQDAFDDFSGVDFPTQVENVTLQFQGDNGGLVLAGDALTGTVVS